MPRWSWFPWQTQTSSSQVQVKIPMPNHTCRTFRGSQLSTWEANSSCPINQSVGIKGESCHDLSNPNKHRLGMTRIWDDSRELLQKLRKWNEIEDSSHLGDSAAMKQYTESVKFISQLSYASSPCRSSGPEHPFTISLLKVMNLAAFHSAFVEAKAKHKTASRRLVKEFAMLCLCGDQSRQSHLSCPPSVPSACHSESWRLKPMTRLVPSSVTRGPRRLQCVASWQRNWNDTKWQEVTSHVLSPKELLWAFCLFLNQRCNSYSYSKLLCHILFNSAVPTALWCLCWKKCPACRSLSRYPQIQSIGPFI